MKIIEHYPEFPLLEKKSYRFLGRDGKEQMEEELVLKEHLCEVYINDILTMKLICLPQYLTELVLGRLLTESIITYTEEIQTIEISEDGKRASVTLTDTHLNTKASPDYVEVTQTACTSNHILTDQFCKTMDQIEAPANYHSAAKQMSDKDYQTVFHLADTFADGMPLHSKTFATHSCLLACKGELVFSCEDIGRHNALDKAIGYALRYDLDRSHCILYSSGRIPSDMVQKAICSGIPVLSSKASPTVEAIELARQNHLILVCAARRDRMKIFQEESGSPISDQAMQVLPESE